MLVTNISARLHIFHQSIPPGACVEVPDDLVPKLKATGVFGLELVEGDQRTRLPEPVKSIKGLKDIPDAGAIALVQGETNQGNLRAWLIVETRDSVSEAIQTRIDELGRK